VGELLVKFFQALRPVTRQLQGALKAPLEGIKAAFYLPFGMGRKLHPMQQIQHGSFASLTLSIPGVGAALSSSIAGSAGGSGGYFITPKRVS
jgi:hypothetical protein